MTDLVELRTDQQQAPSARASVVIRRQRIFIAVTVAAAVVSVAGLIASAFVKSPAQLAADQAPPSPSVLTAPVVKQVLIKTVVLRGTVAAASSVVVTPTAAQGATALVVTRVGKRAGDDVKPGEVLIEVSGRPLIALPGATPAYRDLKPGDSGNDITELQAALRSLGYGDSDSAGLFGSGTKSAVSKLYQHLGYSVPTTGGPNDQADTEALRAAAQATTQAQRTVTADEQAVSSAQAAVAQAQAAEPPDQAAISAAQGALTQAQQNLTYAKEDMANTEQTQARLIATTGVDMPLNEFVFVPSFPAHVGAIHGAVGSTVAAPLVTLDTGGLVVEGVLAQGEQALVKVGLSVQLAAEQLGQTGTGTVSDVGTYTAGSQGQQAQDPNTPQQPAGYPIVVTPDPALPAGWLGQDVRMTIAAAATPGPVLVVPVAAVSTGQDGTTSVTVLRAGNERVRVQVTAGLDSGGLVEVTPAAGGSLNPGDSVVTG